MHWNWEIPNWPEFIFDSEKIAALEKQFLLRSGESAAFLKTIHSKDRQQFVVEILSIEGMNSSRIEGEILDRESLQSSIKKHFGLKDTATGVAIKEAGMAHLLCDVYDTFATPLSHEMLFKWHSMLFNQANDNMVTGGYRSHNEPMQIVGNRHGNQKVFFEAPPSKRVFLEMERFIEWFNAGEASHSILVRAAVSHVYFESIHPFEDGNGRIGRLLVEKILSQGVGKPILIAISKLLEKNKKSYYAELENCNHTLEIDHWVEFFSQMIISAQKESMLLLNFLLEKAKFLAKFSNQINPRQEKVLLRMFAEGIEGFKGGLSAENYLKISKTSRATATRDLTDLVNMGALIKTGELRHTRYWLNIQQ